MLWELFDGGDLRCWCIEMEDLAKVWEFCVANVLPTNI
jgi:hypothetical protein